MASAKITVKDSTGAVVGTATTSSSGTFTLSVSNPSGFTAPLILQADPTPSGASGDEHYSFLGTLDAADATKNHVDITPATSLVLYEATKKNLSTVFSTPSLYKDLSEDVEIAQAKANVIAQFPATLGALTDQDLLHQSFTAGSGTGYDGALDTLDVIKIEFSGDTPALKNSASATVTYDSTTPLFPIASVAVAAGSGGQTADGASLNQIAATVLDTNGKPAKGVSINFSTTAGTLVDINNAVATAAVTDSSGVARLYLKSPFFVGAATVTTESGDHAASGSASVSFIAGAPAAIGLNAAPTTINPGGTTTLTAVVMDANGNLVADGQTISFSTNTTSGGAFSGAPIKNLTTTDGVVSLTYTAGSTAGTETITTRATNGVTQTRTLTLAIGTNAVNTLTLTASNSSIPADGASTTVLTATVMDSNGAGVQGATVNFSTSAGTLPAAATTNASGVASVTLQSGTNVLTARATASVSGYTASTNISFTAGAAAAISLNAAPSAVRPSGTSTITAAVVDGNGNPVANEPVTFSFSARGSGTPSLSATNGTTNANGLISVSYTAGNGSGTDIVTARTSNSITPAPGSVATLSVSSSNAVIGSVTAAPTNPSITAGGASTTIIRATVKDTDGTALPNVSVSFGTTSGSLSASTATTDANGIASVTLTSGTTLLTARVTASAGGFTAATSVNFTAGAASSVTVSAAPATVRPNGASTLYAYVTDAGGNPVAGETVTFSLTARGSGLPSLGSTTAVTNIDGLATIVYTAGSSSGTDTFKAISSIGTVFGTTNITVNASATVVGALELTAGAATLPANGASTVIRATVTDSSGSPAAGISVSFSTSAGSLSAATATTDASGIAQVTLTSSTNLGAATVVANASGFSQTTSVTFVAGSPSTVGLLASPSTVSPGGNSTLTAVVLDSNGNPVVGQTVTFSFTANNTGGSLSTATAVTSADGIASVVYTGGASAATDTVKAALTNGTNTTISLAVAAGTSASSLSIATSKTSVKSDNSETATITVTALSSSNVVVSGVTITFTADGGQLGAATAVTNASGQASVTFSSGTSDKSNRTVNITASATGVTSVLIPIQIVGSTVSLTTNSTNLTAGGAGTSLTVAAKDAGGTSAYNTAVTFTTTGTGTVTITPATGNTDVNGQLTVTVAGTASGSVTVTASALGTTATQAYTISTTGNEFKITAPAANPAALTIGGAPLTFTVQAPVAAGATTVRFSTTLGTWQENGLAVYTAPVAASLATATLASTVAGVANVQAEGLDGSGNVVATVNHTVGITSAASAAANITMQANVHVVPPSTGGTVNTATITAVVRDAGNQVVGNVPVVFGIDNPTGGGETLSPVVTMTSDGVNSTYPLGQAKTTFSSGSLPSGAGGVAVRATVVGTAITTTTQMNIGGTAGSIAIGRSSTITVLNGTTYALPMTVLVADSNGNPVPNAVVTLSAWPSSYSTGTHAIKNSTPQCTDATDDGINSLDTTSTTPANDGLIGGVTGTIANEDSDENLIYTVAKDANADGMLTPPNSAAGSLPATVTTDSSGVANFNLTYLKQNATWITDRIRAKTFVQGTEATSSITFRLPAEKTELLNCDLPSSPY